MFVGVGDCTCLGVAVIVTVDVFVGVCVGVVVMVGVGDCTCPGVWVAVGVVVSV